MHNMPSIPQTPLPQTMDDCKSERELRLPVITPEARCYALKELARRAGVSLDFFRRWKVHVTSETTEVSFGPETHGTIRFLHPERDVLTKIIHGHIPVAQAGWSASRSSALPHSLTLPFCRAESGPVGPLFRLTSLGKLTCRQDILSSLLFTLCRVEETFVDALDEHSRFPASASLAVHHGFLERPILDEYGLAFQQAISTLLPSWRPPPRELKLKLTHDIDDVGIPFGFRSSVAHTVKRLKPSATLRDLLSNAIPVAPAELHQVRRLAKISCFRQLQSAFYWKASPSGPRDSGYELKHKTIQRVVDHLKQSGCELGVHPGYETFANRPKLAAEVNYVREALGLRSFGGRQHYLRWNPATWNDWEACGILYDSSVGFADRFGFRAGTAFPYRPWCFTENRELNMIEVPLILMDCTPVKYMNLDRTEGLRRIHEMIQRMKQTGGVFTLLWHNGPLLDRAYNGWYESVLNMLAGAKAYDVPTKADRLW